MLEPIYDWNQPRRSGAELGSPSAAPSAFGSPLPAEDWLSFGAKARGVKVVDETLRDGLQSASGVNPPVAHKIDLLHAMARVGVNVVSVGLPAAGGKQAEDAYLLCREIQASKLPLIPTGAARTVVSDITGIARASERAGIPIEVYSFIGSSPIRQEVEAWDVAFLVGAVTAATNEAVKSGLPFTLVTEDTTRSQPDVLRALFRAAIDAGASRLCLCDTTGHVTPYGVEELVAFTRRELDAIGAKHVGLDWHAHNDRGLAVPTALWAASNGVDRVHGTGLGIGERVGNTSLELLIENLGRIGARPPVSRDRLIEYCDLAARALSWTIPSDHPIAGAKARRSPGGSGSSRGGSTAAPTPYRSPIGGWSSTPDTLAGAMAGAAPSASSTSPSPRAEGPGWAPRSLATGRRDRLVPMSLRVGGTTMELAVHPRRTLLEALRYDLDLIGTKQGCDKGDCGACTVVLDGEAVLSCLTLALDADGREVQTVETLAGAPHIDPILDCFDQGGGGQCGFCTPGMLMSATALLDKNPAPTRDEIKVAISGNLCRCTGYGRIFDAIDLAARIRRGEATASVDLHAAECLPPPLPSNTREGGARERKEG